MVVLDASAALAFSLPSQANPAVDAFFARTPLPSLRAPGVFRIEARNALLRFERIGAIVAAHADAAWSLIAAMVTLAPLGEIDAGFDGVIALARAERLSFFDACDLDMAIREAASLASLDKALLTAAQRRGIAVEDLR